MIDRNTLLGASALMPGASLFAHRPGAPLMHRGPMIPRSPPKEDGEGGGGDDDDDDNDTPAAIDPAAHAALVTAHDKLKKDAKKARDDLKELRERLEAIEAEKAQAEQEAANKSGDVETVRKQLTEAHDKKVAEVTARAEKAEGQVRKLVIENGLNAALDEVGVKKELKDAAAALLREGVELEDDDDGNPIAMKGGLPLVESIKLWAASDKGKAFIPEGNSGGGAPGGGRPSTAKNPWKANTPDHSLTEQDRIERDDPNLAKRLKAEAGVA